MRHKRANGSNRPGLENNYGRPIKGIRKLPEENNTTIFITPLENKCTHLRDSFMFRPKQSAGMKFASRVSRLESGFMVNDSATDETFWSL